MQCHVPLFWLSLPYLLLFSSLHHVRCHWPVYFRVIYILYDSLITQTGVRVCARVCILDLMKSSHALYINVLLHTHTHTHSLTLSGTAMILPASLSAPRSLMALLLSRVLSPFFLSISPLIEYKNSCRCGFLPTERVDWNAVILIMCL